MRSKEPTTLEFAILGLLHQQSQSGYDIRKVFATTALGNYSSSPGAIYPALRRLEKRGLVAGEVDDANELRPRKLFSPTSAGRALFRAWLRPEISTQDLGRAFEDLMLRFAFHWILDDDTATHRFLVDLGVALDKYIDDLEMQSQLIPHEAPRQPRLALEAGIEQYRAAAKWARCAATQFKEVSS
jgi:DNA-binding PadR family transcriptional regulator